MFCCQDCEEPLESGEVLAEPWVSLDACMNSEGPDLFVFRCAVCAEVKVRLDAAFEQTLQRMWHGYLDKRRSPVG